jgi:hypothetical protein
MTDRIVEDITEQGASRRDEWSAIVSHWHRDWQLPPGTGESPPRGDGLPPR